jgi:hypothetical protein
VVARRRFSHVDPDRLLLDVRVVGHDEPVVPLVRRLHADEHGEPAYGDVEQVFRAQRGHGSAE